MTVSRNVTLFHAPQTRSSGTLTLLEELGAQYELHVLDMKVGEQRQPEYLAINPMGKVPALRHGEAIITEQVAIFLYLGDLYAHSGLTPQLGDPLRGPYLRWTVFYASCFEPALVDRSLNRPSASPSTSPYGDFDTMFNTLTEQLAKGPYLLGDRFTVADVLWGTALTWVTAFRLIPASPVVAAYIDRFNARPAVHRAKARDAGLVAAYKQSA